MLDGNDLKYLEEMERRIIEQAARNTQVVIENAVLPKLQLLAEGQQTILETLAPKSRTEELQEELDFLKSVIRMHTKQLAEQEKEIEQLKKAQ